MLHFRIPCLSARHGIALTGVGAADRLHLIRGRIVCLPAGLRDGEPNSVKSLGEGARGIRPVRRVHDPLQKPASVFGCQGTEPGYAARRGEVPRILGQADEIADRGIGRPGTAERRPGQLRWHAGSQERQDVRSGADRFYRWQTRGVEV